MKLANTSKQHDNGEYMWHYVHLCANLQIVLLTYQYGYVNVQACITQ